jgi:hypothetical protein
MKEARFQRADGFETHEVEDGLIVYHPERERVHYLNATATLVFELCAAARTMPELAALVGRAYGLDAAPHGEVAAAVEQLMAESLLRAE